MPFDFGLIRRSVGRAELRPSPCQHAIDGHFDFFLRTLALALGFGAFRRGRRRSLGGGGRLFLRRRLDAWRRSGRLGSNLRLAFFEQLEIRGAAGIAQAPLVPLDDARVSAWAVFESRTEVAEQ